MRRWTLEAALFQFCFSWRGTPCQNRAAFRHLLRCSIWRALGGLSGGLLGNQTGRPRWEVYMVNGPMSPVGLSPRRFNLLRSWIAMIQAARRYATLIGVARFPRPSTGGITRMISAALLAPKLALAAGPGVRILAFGSAGVKCRWCAAGLRRVSRTRTVLGLVLYGRRCRGPEGECSRGRRGI